MQLCVGKKFEIISENVEGISMWWGKPINICRQLRQKKGAFTASQHRHCWKGYSAVHIIRLLAKTWIKTLREKPCHSFSFYLIHTKSDFMTQYWIIRNKRKTIENMINILPMKCWIWRELKKNIGPFFLERGGNVQNSSATSRIVVFVSPSPSVRSHSWKTGNLQETAIK